MAKKAMIAVLLIFCFRELLGTPPEEADPSQIDSSSQPSRVPKNFELIVQIVTYLLALLMTMVQDTRQMNDVWYCQPLLWFTSLLFGLLGPWMQTDEALAEANTP